jgi:hypothetical protein
MYDDWQRRNKVYTASKTKWMDDGMSQTCEQFVKDNIPVWGGVIDKNVLLAIPLEMAKRIDEQQRTIEELTKKVEMLSKMMIRDTRYATADGTYGDTTDTWLGNTYAAITSCVETTVQDLRAFMEAFENYDQSQIHLIDIQEKQRKRTIQPNRYKYARPIVKSDYRAIYRHQAR